MNPRSHDIFAPLLAVLALLIGLAETASAAFNPSAQNPHYGNFLLRESEASGFSAYEIADPTRGNGEWIYDGALGVPVYVRQNPWTMFDPLGLEAAQDDFFGQVMDKLNHLADSLFHASRDPGGAMASGVDKVINGAVGSPMTGPQEPLKSAGVYQEGSHADKGGDFMVAYAAAVGAAMEGPGLLKGRGPKTINEGWPNSLETTSLTKSSRQIVEDAWTTIDSKGNVLKTDIQVRSIDDPSLLITRGRGEGSHGALAESAGLTETSGLYGTTTTSVNGKVSEVMIGSDAFNKLPKKVLHEQREVIAKHHDIPIEKVYMNKKSVAEDE